MQTEVEEDGAELDESIKELIEDAASLKRKPAQDDKPKRRTATLSDIERLEDQIKEYSIRMSNQAAEYGVLLKKYKELRQTIVQMATTLMMDQ